MISKYGLHSTIKSEPIDADLADLTKAKEISPDAAGEKFDEGKDRWDLLDFSALRDVVQVLTFGAKAHGDNNWKKVPNAKERYFAALMRHVTAWRTGELTDSETGKSHMAHIICNAMFLMALDNDKDKVSLSKTED